MSYGRNLVTAARRHFNAAEALRRCARPGGQPGDGAVAAYLYGLAGELALKELMRISGMRELDPLERSQDPFYKHFPALKSLLRDTTRGRLGAQIRRYAENDALFQHWDTAMRYAPTSEIRTNWLDRWASDAAKLIDDMDNAI